MSITTFDVAVLIVGIFLFAGVYVVETGILQQISAVRVSTAAPFEATSSPLYSIEEVGLHTASTSCWSVINGGVYDLTAWIDQHPGGERRILSICGSDGSPAFAGAHAGESRPEAKLAQYRIGTLK